MARLAVVPAGALREIGRSKGPNSAENSGACANCHAIDDITGGAIECFWVKALFASGVEIRPAGADEFASLIKSEVDKWSKVIKAAGLNAH